jgi:hypothetical protein
MKPLFSLCLMLLILSSCQDIVSVTPGQSDTRLSVDAFLTNQPGNQTIRLRFTPPYTDPSPAPPVSGAAVSVNDDRGNTYRFTEQGSTGDYTWQPSPAIPTLAIIGANYTLNIVYQGQSYQSTSRLNPTTPIDSISYEFRDDQLGKDKGYWAVLNAFDRPEKGNTYWIRTYKNGKYLNRPSEINLAYDAGFKNSGVNNQAFIVPIAEGINPDDTGRTPAYKIGDSLRVEIWSLTEDAYDYLAQAQREMTNGGLFATIPSNVTTNVRKSTEAGGPGVVGFFCVSAVSTGRTVVKP